jgi:hypothetical protein
MNKRTRKPPPRQPEQTPESGSRANREHVESLLDGALADTFPASDPVSTLVPDPSPSEPSSRERARSS